jgi:hypothetical protein
MFEFEDLVSFSLEVDFSKLLESKETETAYSKDIMQNINLRILTKTHMGDLRIALDELKKDLPDIEYAKSIGEYYIRLDLYQGRKLSIDITKTRKITGNQSPEIGEKEPKKFQIEDLKDIDTDFNFLFGHMLGTLKTSQMQK